MSPENATMRDKLAKQAVKDLTGQVRDDASGEKLYSWGFDVGFEVGQDSYTATIANLRLENSNLRRQINELNAAKLGGPQQ